MILRRALSLALTISLGGAVAHAAPAAVVELFTSQGCSSCPPADALLSDLAKRPDVIALSFPVDYWDYLGWKDTLAQPQFTARQRAYAMARGDRQVFTPQAIVNGTSSFIGSDKARLETSLVNAQELPVDVTVRESDGLVKITVEGAPEKVAKAEVWVLPITRTRSVAIGKGENHDRTITYSNIVRGLVRVGEWQGSETVYTLSSGSARGEGDSYVVLLQSLSGTKPGVVLGAARGMGF